MNKWIAEFELEDGDSMPEHMDLYFMGARLDFHCKPVSDCIPIPNDATNGDVIKAMFPNVEIIPDKYTPSVDLSVGGIMMMRVDRNWWNAKYKGVR